MNWPTIPLPAVAIFASGAVYFMVMWVSAILDDRRKTDLQRRQELIDSQARAQSKDSIGDRLRRKAKSYGWPGALTPLFVLMSFVYMLCATILVVVGGGPIIAAMLAFPFSIFVAFMFLGSIATRRQRAFHSQLVSALDLFASALKGGAGPNRAIESVVPALPEPLRGEMAEVLAKTRAQKQLSEAMAELAERYPSRAMMMFVAALRIDEERGGKMADTLEEAANSVRRDFELSAETAAELSQEKMQFYGIVGFLIAMALYMFTRTDPTTRDAFLSPLGLIVLAAGIANFTFGVFSVLRLFSKAKGNI